MISIIIPVFNHAEQLSRCLESIAAQTYKDFEVIIVDDGSLDNPYGIVENSKFKIQNSKFLKQEHKGAPAARNLGFTHSKGEYVLFCDADLQMEQTMLEEMLSAIQNDPQRAFAYSSFRLGWKTFPSYSFDLERLRKMPYIHTSSLIRRECFPGFDESLKKFQDWDLFLRMAEKGYTGIWIPKILYSLTPRKTGMSTWQPSFFYKIPWSSFGIRIGVVERYQAAMGVIKKKHNLV